MTFEYNGTPHVNHDYLKSSSKMSLHYNYRDSNSKKKKNEAS